MKRYLSVNVYKCRDYDCTNEGVTFTNPKRIVVPCERGNLTEEDVERFGYTVLEPREPNLRGHGYPIHFAPKGEKRWVMFGGNFVFTSDGRFGETYGHSPIAVHDRIEG